MKKQLIVFFTILLLALAMVVVQAQDDDDDDEGMTFTEEEIAASPYLQSLLRRQEEVYDTSEFAKEPPYRIALAAQGTSNSWSALFDAHAFWYAEELGEEGVPRTIQEGTDVLLVEGMQELETLDDLVAQLPPMTRELDLDGGCGLAVSTLTAEELATYQELIRYRIVGRVLEESKLTDFKVLLLSHALLQKGFFKPAKSGEVPLQETVIRAQSA